MADGTEKNSGGWITHHYKKQMMHMGKTKHWEGHGTFGITNLDGP